MFYLFQAEKRLLESQKRHLSYVLNVNIKLIKLHLVILILYTEKAISKTCVLYVCTHPRVLNTHTHTHSCEAAYSSQPVSASLQIETYFEQCLIRYDDTYSPHVC